MKNKDFAIFILTHGRPHKVYTYKTLRRFGYTGRIYIVIDNEDKCQDAYIKEFGDQVVVFDKLQIAQTFDTGDNFPDRRTIVYARNAAFEIAKKLGITYFMECDDDYPSFSYRFSATDTYSCKQVKSLDDVLDSMLNFYKSTPVKAIAFSQGGDFIGGSSSKFANLALRRKCMNTIICSTERPFQFLGRINEDVNTYVRRGSIGDLFFTVPNISINQVQTQSNSGGMTDVYLDGGTYLKSFYSVMYNPSCVKIGMMGNKHMRMHHKVNWRYAVPVILSPSV